MILHALYMLAEREQLVADPDFEDKPVAWLVRVDPQGNLIAIEGTRVATESAGRRPSKGVPKSFSVPRQPIRAYGDHAFFLCDKAEYVFGIDPRPDTAGKRAPEKLHARFSLFRNGVP